LVIGHHLLKIGRESVRDSRDRSRPACGADGLEPEVGLEPTTCALRGRFTDSLSIPSRLPQSQSVLVAVPLSRFRGTVQDVGRRAGTQLLG
jgi:hypothetical protein